jgi:uncharacterized protein (DUF1684 family)
MRIAALFVMPALLLAVASGYLEETAKWRAEREASLKAPSGWLSVAGLFWLHSGENVVGSDPQSDVVLPAGAPKRAGVLLLEGGKAGKNAVNVTYDKRVLKTDATDHPDVVQIGTVSFTVIERGGKTGVRLRDPNAETRLGFTGCKWFPADPAWRVKAKWVAYPQPKKIAITNILGMTDEEPSPGFAEFTVSGKTMRLEPVTEDGELFFMFKDATSGKSTYGAGRFLYAAYPKTGAAEVELDFNRSHNPPCAFTAFATCPLPPKQNILQIAVDAGEKSYGNH